MVEAAAGRRSGTSRRRPSGGGEQQQQRLVAVALAARVVMVTSAPSARSAGGGGGGGEGGGGAGGGRCLEDLLGCLLGVIRALGITWAAQPQRQPRPPPPRGATPDGRRCAAELRGIPGRIAGNGACAVASLYTMQGKKGVNQDAMIVWENFCSRDDTIFCGVFDGHGPYGHLVAKRVRDLLPVKLGADLGTDEGRKTFTSNMKSNTSEVGLPVNTERTETTISTGAERNGEYPEIFTALRTSFLRAFHIMDRDLKLHKNIDCFFSGTTAVAVLKQGHNLIIGNLGDSRAVLGTRNEDDQLIAVQLTVDLKPNIPSEAQRIRQRRGRIFALPEEPEVARVWLPKYNSPGLAMARAFGDFCLKEYGLISMPEVSCHHITEKDEFVVLATEGASDGHVAARHAAASGVGGGVSHGSNGEAAPRQARAPPWEPRDGDPDEEDGGGGGDGSDSGSESSPSAGGKDEFILVKLAEIRKEVQCPICLGIIRKTRTVMECLHRFCRDCIDKSMRLGNNECPACRTHCASRRSLRDDPNYDALIASLYPDIDKYEEEELAFSEEEKTRNKKIQATIEETIRRQSEAVGKKRSTAKATANAFARKYRRNMRTRGRGKTVARDIAPTGSDDDDDDDDDREEGNANDVSKESSSADNQSPDLRQKRGRKRPASLSSPVRTIGSSNRGFEENDELVPGKESFTTSPLRGEMLAWGKNGTRSQTRYGNVGGLNGRLAKGGRVAKLVEHLRTTDEMDKEFNLYLVLLPLDGQRTPNLEKPYLCCRPTLSIRHLIQVIALQLSRKVEELEIYIRIDLHTRSVTTEDSSTAEAKLHLFDGLERLREDNLLSDLHPSFASGHSDLELLYALKTQG